MDENDEEYIMVCELCGVFMEIQYKKLTAKELDTLIQMRINQLKEEGATGSGSCTERLL